MSTDLDASADDPRVAQLLNVAAAIAAQREALDRLEAMRDSLVRVLDRESGYSRTLVGRWAGVSRPRVWQILNPSGYADPDSGTFEPDFAVIEALDALYAAAVDEWDAAGRVGTPDDYFHVDALLT